MARKRASEKCRKHTVRCGTPQALLSQNGYGNPQAGGNDEVQRLCGKYGVARGKEKYTVARSEHTTVIGTILFYKNQVWEIQRLYAHLTEVGLPMTILHPQGWYLSIPTNYLEMMLFWEPAVR